MVGIIQHLLLISLILLIVVNRKYLIFYFNKISYNLKLLIFTFLLYEELSFISADKLNFARVFNNQKELNIHNSHLLNIYLFENIPIIGKIGLITLLTSIILFIIGFGSRFNFLNKYKFLFLENKYSYFSFVYFFNLSLTSVFNYFSIVEYYGVRFLYNLEYIELFIYILFLFDTLDKINLAKNKYFNNRV